MYTLWRMLYETTLSCWSHAWRSAYPLEYMMAANCALLKKNVVFSHYIWTPARLSVSNNLLNSTAYPLLGVASIAFLI